MAAVRLSPVPPALSDSRNRAGSSSSANASDHRVPLFLGRAAVQEQHRAAEPGRQVRLQHPAELGVLGEAQRLVALGHDLVADLLEPGQLAGPAGQPGAVAEQVSRVVAHLLELGHGGQHQAAAADVVGGLLDAAEHVGDRGLVQAGLLGGEVAPDLHLLLVRQVGDDRLVGLQAAEHERLGEPLERLRRLRRAVPLDRDRVPLPEPLGRPEQARVGEVHDRPQLGQPVLHRRPGQRDPGRGGQRADRPGLLGGVVLDVLRLVADHPGPVHLAERGLVPGGHAVGGDDQVGASASGRGERLAVQPVRAVVHVHPEVRGEPRRLALPVADQRHRAHQQRGARPRAGRATSDSSWMVLPRPMSSARMPPRPSSPRKDSQDSPRCWYGRSSPEKPAGVGIGRSRWSAWPDSRSPSQPSASTPTSGTSSSGPPAPVPESQAHPGRQRVRRGHRPGLVALEELQRRLQVRVVQLDPLAAQPDQRDLQPGQLGQLVGIERLVAYCHVVPEVHQVTQAEPGYPRPGGRRAGRGPAPRGQLQPEPGLAHPVRQQHAEPGAGQQRPGLLEEPERARGVHLHQGGRRLAQRVVEVAEEPGGGAQAGQQLLHRVAAGREPGAEAGPDVGGGDHQARVVGGLQRELDPPGIGLGGGGLGEPEAGPHRAGRDHGAVPPRVELGGQRGRFRLVLRRHHVDAGIGRGQGHHVPFGQRKAGRDAAAPRGQQRGGQPGPRGRVGQGIQGAAEQRSRVRRPATARQDGGMAAARSRARCASAPPSTGRHRAV